MKKIFLSLILSSSILVSCNGLPSQNTITTPNNNVTAELVKILDEAGTVNDEDINVTVYENIKPTTVGVNSTVLQRGFFRMTPVKGTGSGVIISSNGYILTNNHVISNARQIEVTLSDGSILSPKVVVTDSENDIALLKVDVDKELPSAPLGDSDNVKVGQKILAIGSPFGLTGTLTTGVVSSLDRDLSAEDGTVLKGILQIDAAINPGNSGGPLINTRGEIIGINTAIFSPNGANIGIGFSVPINKVKELMEKAGLKFE